MLCSRILNMSQNPKLSVKVNFPSLKHIELCNIEKSLEYDEVLQIFCNEIDELENCIVNISINKELLGYCVPIYKSIPNTIQQYEATLSSIVNNDTLIITRSCDILSMKYHISLLKQLFTNKVLIRELTPIMSNKICYRSFPIICFQYWNAFKPENDHNNYYRSVYFSIFEQIILEDKFEYFLILHNIIQEYVLEEYIDDDMSEVMKSLLLASSKFIYLFYSMCANMYVYMYR